ncbi:MAG: signal peptidase I [Gammaproteobacteria bacterium]|nr:signal peptidase I [Gammaproteobacteria bacterium]
MDFDLETILTALTVISGLIWLVDALVFARPRRRRQQAQAAPVAGAPQPRKRRDPVVVDYAKSFFPVLLAVLLLRSFVVEPFHIPSSSMVPTLLVGDFILVNKFDYGLRLPVIHTRIVPIGEPRRGDVVVFHYPENSARRYCQSHPLCADTGSMREVEASAGTDYIKRVIGLPGDHIAYRDGVLYINGVAAPGRVLGLYTGSDALGATLRRETLGGVTHDILAINGQLGPQGEWMVPAGEYFVMGDNRGNSFDSRWWGFVPERNIVGKAFFVWMNWDAFHDSSLWHRVGTVIH